MDADGYPDDDDLERVTKWPHDDLRGLLDYMRERWAFKNYWHEDGGKAYVSTAGWSGNESFIAAMKANVIAWHVLWEQSRRGGHYIFDLERLRSD